MESDVERRRLVERTLPESRVYPLRLRRYSIHARTVSGVRTRESWPRLVTAGVFFVCGYARDNRPLLEVYRNPAIAGLQHACVTDLMIPIRKD